VPIPSSLFPPTPNPLRRCARIATALVAITFIAACGSDKPDPTGLMVGDPSRNALLSGNAVASTGKLSSPGWQETARTLVAGANLSPLAAGRAYPLLGVAQYLAVQEAEAAIGGPDLGTSNPAANGIGAGGRSLRLETDRGAVAGASAVVLSYLFPTKAASLEEMAAAQSNPGNGQPHYAFAAGEAIGRAVGAQIVERARADHFGAPNNAIPLTGDGSWISSPTPGLKVAGGQLPGVTPWFLTSASQYRPGAPPAFRTAAFTTALTEIRTMADTGNAEQRRIAGFWALNPGTMTASGYWLELASNEIVQRGLSEREATHVFALTSATMFDAVIACWDAKLTYWLIRPWNADPLIVPLASMGTPPPNHPSYPSGHSCVSSSGAAVIAGFFPDKAAELEAMVTEAGLSRMYGGIHYRFDIEAGQTLGRSVAAFAIERDASGTSVLTAH
jgi:membrane-associated phospholipid phosphatase